MTGSCHRRRQCLDVQRLLAARPATVPSHRQKHQHQQRVPRSQRPAQNGFTLLEMIAALALLALAMVAVSGGIGAAVRTMLPSTTAIEASELAHAKLDSICIDAITGPAVTGTTQQAGQNARARWQLTVSPGAREESIQLINAALVVHVGERQYRFNTVCAVNAS